jgi:hypothetical protein
MISCQKDQIPIRYNYSGSGIWNLTMVVPLVSVVDPDPDTLSFWSARSGSRRAKSTHKSEENSSFEVLDVLF